MAVDRSRASAPLIRRKRAYAAAALGLLFLLAGMVSIWNRIRVRQTWVTVDARVRISQPASFGHANQRRYRTQLELSFTDKGNRYSVPVSLPESTSDLRVLNDQLLRYRSGASVPIFYNPADPEEIEIDLGSSARFYAFPLVLLGGGLVLLTVFFVTIARDGKYHCAACGTGVAELHACCFNCGKKIPARKGKIQE